MTQSRPNEVQKWTDHTMTRLKDEGCPRNTIYELTPQSVQIMTMRIHETSVPDHNEE